MQHLMRRFDIPFQNAVELKGLPVGDPDTAVQRLFCSKFVYSQPLFRCDHTSGKRQRSIMA